MKREEFEQKVNELVAQDGRFKAGAYRFVADAVSYTAKQLRDSERLAGRHISGQELLEGIREYALACFGPLALDVLTDWGVAKTEDFGAIVFRMVNKGLLGSSDQDSPADFAGGYDFHDAFLKPFLTSPPGGTLPPPSPII